MKNKRRGVLLFSCGLVAVVSAAIVLGGGAPSALPLVRHPTPEGPVSGVQEVLLQPKKHIQTDAVRALYATMYTAGNTDKLGRLITLADETEVNAVVVDVKGSGGELIFDMLDTEALVQKLHDHGIYAIARIVVFQDSGIVEAYPDAAITKKNGGVWRDRRGFAWADPASSQSHERIIAISKRAADAGFDEINYDYIRFPTDGNMTDMRYPVWDEQQPRSDVIAEFARTARAAIRAHDPDVALSIDIFGYTFIRSDDLGIGQRLESLVDAFDGIYPMVYPSHYSTGNFGFQNPADHPYEVIVGTLESGFEHLGEKADSVRPKVRPWLQAFNLGARYTPDKMRAQMQATLDGVGAATSTGWLLWDPKNEYPGAREYLDKEDK